MTLKVDVVVRQLSTRGGSYVNVLGSLNDGGIGVWGHAYKHPTYLLLRVNNWLIVTFDDDAWRDEELPRLIRTWAPEDIYILPTMEKVDDAIPT